MARRDELSTLLLTRDLAVRARDGFSRARRHPAFTEAAAALTDAHGGAGEGLNEAVAKRAVAGGATVGRRTAAADGFVMLACRRRRPAANMTAGRAGWSKRGRVSPTAAVVCPTLPGWRRSTSAPWPAETQRSAAFWRASAAARAFTASSLRCRHDGRRLPGAACGNCAKFTTEAPAD